MEFNRFALTAVRSALQMSKSRLAATADVSVGTVSDLESGRRRPSHVMVERLADALGISPLALICPCNGETDAGLGAPRGRRRQVPAPG